MQLPLSHALEGPARALRLDPSFPVLPTGVGARKHNTCVRVCCIAAMCWLTVLAVFAACPYSPYVAHGEFIRVWVPVLAGGPQARSL